MQQMAQESIRCFSGDKLMCNGKNIGNLVPQESSQCIAGFMSKRDPPHHQNSPPSDIIFNKSCYSVQSRLRNEF